MRQILCSRLIGRDEEMTVLSAALAAAGAGRGGAVIVLGEPGVGKSRLAQEVETLAQHEGLQTLRGRAVEESTGAYRPITEALLSTVRAGGLPDTAELKPFRSILGRLIPEWREGDVQAVADDSPVPLGEAILRLLRTLGAGRGCLLVLEDLHWADADTLAVIEYLTDNLRTEPVLLLATIRSEERSAALVQAGGMAARRAGLVLELPRLDQENVEGMARVCLDVETCPAAVIDLLASYTEGLPFLVEELLAAWIGSGALVQGAGGWEIVQELSPIAPLTFADTVNRRLRTLGDETRHLLEIAAVLGRHFDWSLLPDATGLDEQQVLERLRLAIDAQLVTADYRSGSRSWDGPGLGHGPRGQAAFGFRHALTRSAVLAGLLPPERAALSARMLSLVEAAHPDLPGEWCDLAAGLAEAAGSTDRAAQILLQSGQRALARGALATAESTLDGARGLEPDDQALVIEIAYALTHVLSLAGKWERVFEVSQPLLVDLKAASAPPERQAEVYLYLARAALAAGHWSEAADHLDRARHLAGRPRPGVDSGQTPQPSAAGATVRTALLARLDALAAHVAIERAHLEEATAFAQSALEGAERAGLPEVACEALEALGRCARVGDLDPLQPRPGGHPLHGGSNRIEVHKPGLEERPGHGLQRLVHPLVQLDLVVESSEDGGDAPLLGRRGQEHGDQVKVVAIDPWDAALVTYGPIVDRPKEI